MSLSPRLRAFLRSAKEHAEAARVLYGLEISDSIFCYLTSTAAEMYGKFVLVAKGETSKALKVNFGHNVSKIYIAIGSLPQNDLLRPSDTEIRNILRCVANSSDIPATAGANAFKYPHGNLEKWPQDWLTKAMVSDMYEKSLPVLERLISQADSASGQQS